jgi:centractin
MELLWRHVYDLLKVSPKEHPVLLTEAPLNPFANRKQAAELFFERFQSPSIFFQTQAVLSLYAQGKTTGVVLDCGDGVCHCSPVFEGFSINTAVQRIDIGGRDVTYHLMQLLRRSGYSFHTTAEFEIVRKIKEKWCYVAPMGQLMTEDLYNLPSKGGMVNVGMASSIVGNAAGVTGATDHQTSYFLPDGSQVMLNKEKILAPEILFAPERIGLEYPGIHEMVVTAIKKCDIDLRK